MQKITEQRDSFKLDLALSDGGQIELFSFTNSPRRVRCPEAQGLRHLASCVECIDTEVMALESHSIAVEAIRVDEYTNKRFTFF